MTVQVDIKDPAASLVQVVDRARHGEEVLLTEAGNPVARVTAVVPVSHRRAAPGSFAEFDWLIPIIDAPTDEEIIKDFGL